MDWEAWAGDGAAAGGNGLYSGWPREAISGFQEEMRLVDGYCGRPPVEMENLGGLPMEMDASSRRRVHEAERQTPHYSLVDPNWTGHPSHLRRQSVTSFHQSLHRC